jgi:CATRA-associated small protein
VSGSPERMVFGADDLAEALSVLDAAMAWKLLPARWAEVNRSLAALAAALADGDNRALRSEVSRLELLGPVRQASRAATLPAPADVRALALALAGAVERLAAAGRVFPVSIYLADEAVHVQVERAVDLLLRQAGLRITEREEPVSGSAVHAADARLFLRQDAELTTLLLQNLGPVITALQPTKDAVVRAGALLIVTADWVVAVHQLTPRQQLMLDHAPHLESEPHQVLKALGIAGGSIHRAAAGDRYPSDWRSTICAICPERLVNIVRRSVFNSG